ncbi:MAG: class II aldolase/adducin family protein [Phycisphaerae bacterium]
MAYDFAIREQICEIGRRIYAKGFVAGNAGNISCRLADGRILCSPTMICKGFMKPDDLCVVSLDGQQRTGAEKKTSEILLHLQIYRSAPKARAVVHCHPPHATAFAVARVDIPTGILPETEVFLGQVPRIDYETPGTDAFAAKIEPVVNQANTALLCNHGTVSWADSVERAYWYTEILEDYCRVLLLAKQLGHVERLPAEKVRELLALRPNFDMPPDPRLDPGAKLFVNPDFPHATDR